MYNFVRVIRYLTRPLNPSSMSHAAAANKGAAVIAYISRGQDALDIDKLS